MLPGKTYKFFFIFQAWNMLEMVLVLETLEIGAEGPCNFQSLNLILYKMH